MGRFTRAQQQARTRARVLSAAGEEFAAHGFRDAKVDRIAERADLTRGAVYSNFPGKRALYFSVLAEAAEHAVDSARREPGQDSRAALGALARAWACRPSALGGDLPAGAGLTPELLADESSRTAFAQAMRLNALLLGVSLEALDPPAEPGGRRVRLAEAVLTSLYGASQVAGAAPGFVDPFIMVRACEGLADLDLDDTWPPPHLAHVSAAEPVEAPWAPPEAFDAVRRRAVSLSEDGVVAVLGTERLEAVEEALRAVPSGEAVTVVVVTEHPAERIPLARTVLADVCGCLRRAFPERAWPHLRVVFDGAGGIAAAAGVPVVDGATESAVRVVGGRIRARSDTRGAGHAVASFPVTARC